jgi:hypothetical protein
MVNTTNQAHELSTKISGVLSASGYNPERIPSKKYGKELKLDLMWKAHPADHVNGVYEEDIHHGIACKCYIHVLACSKDDKHKVNEQQIKLLRSSRIGGST